MFEDLPDEEIVEPVKEDLFDDFDPDSTEPIDRAPIIDHYFNDPEGEPIGDLP